MNYDAAEFLESLFRPADDLPAIPGISPDDLPPDWRYAWEERAAIMEYGGGLPKEHAETAALADTLEVMRRCGAWPVRNRLERG
jgi:hypothetical protein